MDERTSSDRPGASGGGRGPRRGLRRRDLLAGAGAAGLGVAWLRAGLDLDRAARTTPTAPGAPGRTFDPAAWRALEAALARLLPSDDLGPGAPEVNAVGYLDAALAEPRISPSQIARVKDGAARLDARARARGVVDFAALPPAAQDEVLRLFEGHPNGRLWLKDVLTYALEAFLGDPVRGVNPDEIGWRWAGHEPGWPRPEEPGWLPEERTS